MIQAEWAECAGRQRALRASARERGDALELAHAGSVLALAVLESHLLGGDASASTLAGSL